MQSSDVNLRRRREPSAWLPFGVWACLAYAACAISYLYPKTLFLHGDDFGYAENLLQTYWNEKYTPSHWLAPVNWTLATFGAFVLHVTGSFAAASLGLNFLFFVLTLFALERLFAAAGLPLVSRALAIVVLYANPTLFGKTLEYTGITLSFLFVVVALLGSLRNAPLVILAGGLGATFTRQSGIGVFALLAAPTVLAVLRRERPSQKNLEWLGLGLVGVAVAALGLSLLPKGWTAQHYASPGEMLKQLDPIKALRQLPVLIVSWANATLIGQILSGHWTWRTRGPRNWVIGGSITAALGVLGALGVVELTPTFNMHWPGHYSVLWRLSTVALLFIDYSSLAWTKTLVAGLGASVLLLARGIIWDPYLLDTFLFFLVAASEARGAPTARLGVGGLVLLSASALLLGINSVAGMSRLREAEALAVLFENAQRSGEVQVLESNLSDALSGWKIFGHYIEEQNSFTAQRDLMGMKNYLAGAKYYVLRENAMQRAKDLGQVEAIVASTLAGPPGFRARYSLARLSLPRQMAVPLTFGHLPKFRRLPITNAEWTQLAKQGGFFPTAPPSPGRSASHEREILELPSELPAQIE